MVNAYIFVGVKQGRAEPKNKWCTKAKFRKIYGAHRIQKVYFLQIYGVYGVKNSNY